MNKISYLHRYYRSWIKRYNDQPLRNTFGQFQGVVYLYNESCPSSFSFDQRNCSFFCHSLQQLNATTKRCLPRKMCPALRRPPVILRRQSRNCDTCWMNRANSPHHWTLNRRRMAFLEAAPYWVLPSLKDCSFDDLSNSKYLQAL